MRVPVELGEHIFTGLKGLKLLPSEVRLIKRFRPAGFVLFGRNVKSRAQVSALCREIYSLYSSFGTRIPAIAIDHEGWPVDRFSRLLPSMPGNPILGAAASGKLAKEQGSVMARDLSGLGINVDFSPVLDLLTPSSPPVVAFRSLSSSASVVSRLGPELIAGLDENSVLACVKHFPGIGDCSVDPHFHVPYVSYGTEVFNRSQIKPFRAVFQAGVQMLMVGHVCGAFGPDGQKELSTCSETFLSTIRRKLGFKGVLVSDDMHMRALTDMFGMEEACLRALGAGMDILLLCRPIGEQEKVLSGLEKKFKKKPLSLNKTVMKRFFASLSVPEKVKSVGLEERRALIDQICSKGLKPEIFSEPGRVLRINTICIRPRYTSFPGASRIYWDGLFDGIFSAGLNSGQRINLFPQAGNSDDRKDRARIKKTVSRFNRGDFVLLCWDGVYGRELLCGLIDALSLKGCKVAVVGIAKNKSFAAYKNKICFYLNALSGLKCALELSGHKISAILRP